MAVFLSPIGIMIQFFSDLGVVGSGYKVNTYLAGTSTPQQTFTDATGLTPNANPIVLNSNGRLPASVWQTAGVTLKMIVTDPTGAPIPNLTIDNLPGINDSSAFTFNAFTSLIDTFAWYTGKANQVITVKAAENGLEARTLSSANFPGITTTLLALTDGPGASPGYVGQAGKTVTVNSTETGWIFDGFPLGDAQYVMSGGLAVTGGVNTPLQFNTSVYDQLKRGTFNTGTFLYTAGTNGARVLVGLAASIAALAASASMRLSLQLNATTSIAEDFKQSFAGGSTLEMQANTGMHTVTLGAGQTVRGMINCSSNQTVDSAVAKTRFTIVELA